MSRRARLLLAIAAGLTLGCHDRPPGPSSPPASSPPASSASPPGSSTSPATTRAETKPPEPKATSWAPIADGSTVLVFRDVLVGMLPYPSRRTTFTMIRSPGSLRLRVEAQAVRGASFQHVDRTTHDDKRWGASLRAEYALEPAPAALAKVRLARSFGPDGELEGVRRQPELPDAITLACKTEAVKVRPADAEQRPGRGGGGDGVAKPSWAPASVEVVPNALVCKLGEDDQDEVLLPFTEALTFVPARKSGKSEAAGVEWAFDNSDMVIQHGGLRWIPASAVTTSP